MTREQTKVLEQIATAQSQAVQDFMARMDGRHEALPPTYRPDYAVHGCAICGGTERLSDDCPCRCRNA